MADLDEIRLNVAAVSRGSRVNGPGLRAVVWVQGCTIGCAGCFNPETHPHDARQLVHPEELARELCVLPGLDGVTLSGGEPFEQAAACSRFAEEIRSQGQSLLVFTGYPYRMLADSALPEVQRLLGAIDLIVAGPYIRTRPMVPNTWRSSSNQELLALTERGELALQRHSDEAPCVEASSDGTSLSWSGFPAPGDLVWLQAVSSVRAQR